MNNEEILSGMNKIIRAAKKNNLSNYNKNYNFFDISQAKEVEHTKTLGWLLDPYEGHNLKDVFYKSLLKQIKNSVFDENNADRVQVLNKQRFIKSPPRYVCPKEYEIHVFTELTIGEKCKADILIQDEKNDILILIENKFGAREGMNQTICYSKAIKGNKVLSDYTNIIKVYLDFNSNFSKIQQDWFLIDYSWIVQELDSLHAKEKSVSHILKDYYNYISDDYENYTQYKGFVSKAIELHKIFWKEIRNIKQYELKLSKGKKIKLRNLNRRLYSFNFINDPTDWKIASKFLRNSDLFELLFEYGDFYILSDAIKEKLTLDLEDDGSIPKTGHNLWISTLDWLKYRDKKAEKENYYAAFIFVNRKPGAEKYEIGAIVRKNKLKDNFKKYGSFKSNRLEVDGLRERKVVECVLSLVKQINNHFSRV